MTDRFRYQLKPAAHSFEALAETAGIRKHRERIVVDLETRVAGDQFDGAPSAPGRTELTARLDGRVRRGFTGEEERAADDGRLVGQLLNVRAEANVRTRRGQLRQDAKRLVVPIALGRCARARLPSEKAVPATVESTR